MGFGIRTPSETNMRLFRLWNWTRLAEIAAVLSLFWTIFEGKLLSSHDMIHYIFGQQLLADWHEFATQAWPSAVIALIFIFNNYLAMFRFKQSMVKMRNEYIDEFNDVIDQMKAKLEAIEAQLKRLESK